MLVTEGINACVEVIAAVLIAVGVALGMGRISVEVAAAGDECVGLGDRGSVGVVRGRIVLTLGGAVVAVELGIAVPAVGLGKNRSAANPAI